MVFELKRNVFDDKKSGQDFMTVFYKKVNIFINLMSKQVSRLLRKV